MPPGSIRKDPAVELRDALIQALIEIPFVSALPDRRLLIQLIRRDVVNFPDVQEHAEIRLHVVQIMLSCLGHPGGLRALVAALSTMAPEAPGSKRAMELIEAASLHSLLPEGEMRQIHHLLRRAEEVHADPGWWRPATAGLTVAVPADIASLATAFDLLCMAPARRDPVPAALILVDQVADLTDGPIVVELRHWARGQAERLEVQELFLSRNGPAVVPDDPAAPRERPADTSEPDSAGPRDDISQLTETGPASIISDSSDGSDSDDEADQEIISRSADPQIDSDASSLLGDAMPPVATTTPSVTLPQVWGDVPQRNQNFTGREELLRVVHEALAQTRETAVLPQALHGMGGVGKSQVAIEYVHRHSAEYDLVWWVPSEQEGQILTSLTQLSQRLRLDVSPEANSAVPAVREALSTGQIPYRNWLLVFDNAESPEDVQKYFPTGGAGKILVTSRDLEWSRVTRSIEVDVFSPEESREFLLARNPELSKEEADQLSEALGHLPLAIEQAAAWRAATGMPVQQYLALLEDNRLDLLDTSPSPDYRDSVAAAFKMSLDKLLDVNEAALQLLQICSFFAPEPISRDLFAGSPVAPITPELDAILSDNFRLSRAIRDIQRYALARIDHKRNGLQIHRLVQAVLIGGMTEDERTLMRRGAHTLLANGNPNNPRNPDAWTRYQALRPHVTVSRAVESPDPRVQQLVFGIVQFLYHWGDHTGSERLAADAYHWWVQNRGESDPLTLQLAKWLGFTRWKNGKFKDARELNQRTLSLYRETLGDNDEGTIDAMSMVAIDLRTSGDFVSARDLDEQALTVARRQFDLDDPVTLGCAYSLGVSLRLNGEFKRAGELDVDTHRLRELTLGTDDEATLESLNAILIDLRENGSYLEAEKRQDALYRKHVAQFGHETPATLRAARYLSIARRKAGDHPGARSLAADTLERYRRRYGDDYPDTIATAVNYAVDLRQNLEFGAALELGTATHERYQRMFGLRHSYTLSARTNLAIVLRLTGDLAGAYAHDSEAWQMLQETLGVDHPVTLTCATNLASDLYALGRFQEAYERDTGTLARSERVLGVEHPSTLAVGVNLALDLRGLNRINEGDKILADTMIRLRRQLGEKHPATLNALQSIRADCDVDPMPI